MRGLRRSAGRRSLQYMDADHFAQSEVEKFAVRPVVHLAHDVVHTMRLHRALVRAVSTDRARRSPCSRPCARCSSERSQLTRWHALSAARRTRASPSGFSRRACSAHCHRRSALLHDARRALLNTKLSLVRVYTAFNLPFVVWMMRGFSARIPREIEGEEAGDGRRRLASGRASSRADAAGSRRLAATAVFCLIISWNEFLFALVDTDGAAMTLPVGIAGPRHAV